MTGVCLLGQIVNNCVTNNAKLPLSAAQGKVLMDLYNVLNTNQQNMLYKDMFSGDLNSTSIENGVYSIGTLDAVKNAPTGVSWCTFIQLKPYTTQVILDTSGCYMRKYTGSPAKWSQWQAF